MANPARKKFGFGKKLAVVNIDVQKAYTSGEFATSYMTDPKQVDYINEVSHAARNQGLPVVWTHVAYMEDGSDAGIWGTRTNTPDSLQNIKIGSRRGEFDDRVEMFENDAIYLKKMPSCFHETQLQSLLIWHQIDTVVLTGGSTSGCVRASAVECLSRVTVPSFRSSALQTSMRATTLRISRTWYSNMRMLFPCLRFSLTFAKAMAPQRVGASETFTFNYLLLRKSPLGQIMV